MSPQKYSGFTYYWKRYPREICPKCGKKTYIQPSKAEVWHDLDWRVVRINGVLKQVLQRYCYLCGYKEPLDTEYWERKENKTC